MSVIRCKRCREFVKKEDSIKLGVSSFCSEEHLQEWQRERMAKQRERLISRSVEKDIPLSTRQRILSADGHHCRFCGTPYLLHIHHITYRSEGGDHEFSKLITLCWEHHDLVHSDKSLYQPLCRAIVWSREIDGNQFLLMGDLV